MAIADPTLEPNSFTVTSRLPEPTDEDIRPEPADDSLFEHDPDNIGPGRFPGIRKPFRSLWWLVQVLLGVGFLLPLLSLFASLPGISLLSLGFMLDAEAQVGRSGRFRYAVPLLAVSTRVGTIGFMVLLFLGPIMGISANAEAQNVIHQLSGRAPGGLNVLLLVVQFVVFLHLVMAIANGGAISCFLRPIRNTRRFFRRFWSGEFASAANFWATRFQEMFRPWHHLKLALYGVGGALIWLAIPTALLGTASTRPHADPGPAVALSLLGGALLVPVAAWLPLLQCHQAVTERFSAIFELKVAREIICRAPIRWAVATILIYGLAIPLYLSKVVLPPADAFWLFTPLFIVVIYPTRILMGWVYGTGMRMDSRSPRIIRWPTKVFMIPLLGVYALILFAVPMTSELGRQAMFENHAFLLPVPSGQFGQ